MMQKQNIFLTYYQNFVIWFSNFWNIVVAIKNIVLKKTRLNIQVFYSIY